MQDPDHDAEPERRTDPRYDAFPIRRYDAHTKWPIERAAPGEDEGRQTADMEWVGAFGAGTNTGTPYVYAPEDRALLEARLDEDEERVVVDEDGERHELEESESLGERLEAIGQEHGWTWLSSFAREHLEEQGVVEEGGVDRSQGLTYEHASFDRKNLLDDATADLAFVGSHTFSDERDRRYVLEREFDVFRDESTNGARITVREDVREATGEKRDRQAGDADLADRAAFELAIDLDADGRGWEQSVADAIETWHRDHRGPAAREVTKSDVGSVAVPGSSSSE